jgi:LAS superfamily LD-carboxypeptidase LdcB
MLTAAANGGASLCGGGYRNPQEQIDLRRAHCGPTDYDIYEAPSSACSPPTARPGTSQHEQGLAIDFTCNGGGAISGSGSVCFQWLDANAASYGFYNLPSEPWHWSTTGN